MKNRLHIILWLLVIILLSITYIVFSDTLALFETNSTGTVNTDIGKWVIEVNGEDITDGVDESFVIDNFVYAANQHVESGFIAPGGSAYFDLVIDATDCDVAVLFDVTFDLASSGYGSNIAFSVNDINNYGIIKTGANTYSGVIPLSAIINNQLITIRVNMTWTDDPNYNEADTELGEVEGNVLDFPINFHAKQYLNDTLSLYCDPGYGLSNQTTCSRCGTNYISTGGHVSCEACSPGTCSNSAGTACSAEYCP